MPHHFLIDRIQIRMVQLFGHEIFPNHTNQTLFNPVQGFVAVGVGPLNYDEKCVSSGNPLENLSGDMKFLAERMKLVGPPLHMSTKEEKKIFNDFMKNHPKPPSKTWMDMAAFFKGKADYKTMFPKLPSMLKAHYTKWKVTQDLKMIKASINEKYYSLLKELGTPTERSSDSNPGAVFQREASQPTVPTEEAEVAAEAEALNQDTTNDFNSLPENPDIVAPMGAPRQVRYVATRDRRGTKDRVCSGYPLGCTELTKECSGRNRGWRHCKSILEGRTPRPTDEVGDQKVREHDAKRRAASEQRRRDRKAAAEAEAAAAAAAEADLGEAEG